MNYVDCTVLYVLLRCHTSVCSLVSEGESGADREEGLASLGDSNGHASCPLRHRELCTRQLHTHNCREPEYIRTILHTGVYEDVKNHHITMIHVQSSYMYSETWLL